jgi:O-antigen ligase
MKIRYTVLWLVSGWGVILTWPSLLMIFGKQSSFSTGILLASLLFVSFGVLSAVSNRKVSLNKANSLCILTVLFLVVSIVVHFVVVNISVDLPQASDYGRFVVSLLSLSLVLFASILSANYLVTVNENDFHQASRILSLLLLMNSIISLSKIDFFSTGLEKPNFIYLEPSHFSLVVAPFVIYYLLTAKRFYASILLAFVFLWAGYIQNMTMMLVAIMAFLVSTRRNLVVAVSVLSILGMAIIPFLSEKVMKYFTNRLEFSDDTNNLSVLVLFQGWENAIRTIQDLSWLGVGFQQFGVTTLAGSSTEKLFNLMGFELNKYDGGSTAPKIIGEFGVLGIIFNLLYFLGVAFVFYKLRKRQITSSKILFFYSVCLAGLLEFYVRGVGYFSPLLFMLLVSLFCLLIIKVNKAKFGGGGYESGC